MEGEEGVGFVDAYEALPVPPVDDEPDVRFLGVKVHGVEQVARPEDFGAVPGVVGGEDAEDHVVFRQEERVQVRGFDGAAGEGGEDGGFAGFGGHAEDAVGRVPAHFQVVVVPVPGDGVGAGVGACEGSFEVGVERGLAYGGDWFEGCGVDALERGVVRLEPEVVDLWGGRIAVWFGLGLFFARQRCRHRQVRFDRHPDVHSGGCLVTV